MNEAQNETEPTLIDLAERFDSEDGGVHPVLSP